MTEESKRMTDMNHPLRRTIGMHISQEYEMRIENEEENKPKDDHYFDQVKKSSEDSMSSSNESSFEMNNEQM